MRISELLFFLAFGAVATFFVTMMYRNRLRKRQIRRTLATRNQNDDDGFRRHFADPKRADIAVRVRRVLSQNLRMPLEGLAPGDRLDDDLDAELAANPHLFWDLETEFGIKTGVGDLETFEQTLERVVTFQDLVELVEEKLSQPAPATTPEDPSERSSRPYELAIRSIPILCIAGLAIVVGGILVQRWALTNLGGLVFLSGFVVWGLANGGEMLRSLIQEVRRGSLKEIAARPWPYLVTAGLCLFFLWVGGFLLWGILKNLLAAK